MSLLVFLEINFKFQPEVCNGCHDLTQKSMIFNDIAIFLLNKKIIEFIFLYMSKYKGIDLLKNVNLTEKSGIL